MKITCHLVLLGAVLMISLAACGKKADVKSSVAELERAFPAAAAPTPPAPVEVQPQAPTPTPVPAPQAGANELVRAALTAARANDYAGGVIALQEAQQQPGVTAEQVMAVQRTKLALVAELQRRADNGDRAALAQLRAIEKTRSQ